LEDAAAGKGNVVPVVLDAVKTFVSLGEISDVFRKVFGEYSGSE